MSFKYPSFFISIIWVVIVILIAYLSYLYTPYSTQISRGYTERFSNWDGRHFLSIAEFGYKETFQYAFFPLYPILINFLTLITKNYLVSGLFINLSLFFGSIYFLYKLIKQEFKEQVAKQVIFYLLIFPTSFFLIMIYSEGLFLFLSVLTFYFIKKKNIKYAVIATALATATRITGLALVLTLLFYLYQNRSLKRNWFVVFSMSGLIFYMGYLYLNTGNPFYFLIAEQYWQREVVLPTSLVWQTISNLVRPNLIYSYYITLLDFIFLIFGLGLILRSFRFLPRHYSIYSLSAIALPLFTSSVTSMPRFLLVIFPLFIVLAKIKSRLFKLVYVSISAIILYLYLSLYIAGFWVS